MNKKTVLELLSMAALTVALSVPAVAKTLKIGTEASYPPFSQTEPNGTFSGFEIDLGNEICKRAGLSCEWVKQSFDGMIASVNARKLDMVISSMSIKPEREKVVDFSIPYYVEKNRFYTSDANTAKVESGLEGKSVGVYSGATQETFIKSLFPKMEVRGYGNIDQINADLVAGRIDYAFNTTLSALSFLKSPEGKGYGFVGPEYDQVSVFGPGIGVVFHKGDDVLRAEVNNAIKSIYADGTFDKLQQRYFSGANLKANGSW